MGSCLLPAGRVRVNMAPTAMESGMNQSGKLDVKHALIPAVINGVINGGISWVEFSGSESIALSVDSIASGAKSAIGNAVMVATALGLILSLINFALERRADTGGSRPGVLRAALVIAVKNAFFLFGLFVAVGVLWQRMMGTISVGPLAATLLTAVVAFGVSAYLYFAVHSDHADWTRRG